MDRKGITTNRNGYSILVVVIIGFLGSLLFIPSNLFPDSPRSIIWAFVFGLAVGTSELVTRYRDEPLRALATSFGLVYIIINGALAVYALFIVLRFPDKFGFDAKPLPAFLSALLAGFGSMTVMRTRLMVLKNAENKDISVGPDAVIKTLLQMVDQYVDRNRAAIRLEIVTRNLKNFEVLHDKYKEFNKVADYLLASLLAFQNLDDERKKQLQDIFLEYNSQEVPVKIKYLAMSYVFLTLVGESHFEDSLQKAVQSVKDSALDFQTNPSS